MRGKKTGQPGPLVPERTAVPDPDIVRTSEPDEGELPLHKHTNTVEGLQDPNTEPMAPGRTTHGATNNP